MCVVLCVCVCVCVCVREREGTKHVHRFTKALNALGIHTHMHKTSLYMYKGFAEP